MIFPNSAGTLPKLRKTAASIFSAALIFSAATPLAFAAGNLVTDDAVAAPDDADAAPAELDFSQSGVKRTNAEINVLDALGDGDASTGTAAPAAAPSAPQSVRAANSSVAQQAASPALPEKQRAFLFDCELDGFARENYAAAVKLLFASYEKETGRKLVPAEKKKVALKIYTNSGKGLATPPALTAAVRDELVRRGFPRENVLIVDLSEKSLRQAGYLPPFRRGNDSWEGSPVLALDTGKFYNEKWFFENPLPSREASAQSSASWEAAENDRRSYLPVPLLFDVDFWINLPVATDSSALGVSGALANATLWNVSNQKRFLESPANAQAMAVGVASIPEFRKKFEFTLLTLEKYQFIGGQKFYAEYTTSEKRLWLSANPVMLDYLMWLRMNALRVKRGFEPILPEPPVFAMASKTSAALGSCVSSEITLIKLSEKKKK